MAFRLDVLGSLSKKIRKPKTELPESENTPNTPIPSPEQGPLTGAGVPQVAAPSVQADPEQVPEQPVQEAAVPAPESLPVTETGNEKETVHETTDAPVPDTTARNPPAAEESPPVQFAVPWPVISHSSEAAPAEPASSPTVTEEADLAMPVPPAIEPASSAPAAAPVPQAVPEPVPEPVPETLAQTAVPAPAPVAIPVDVSPATVSHQDPTTEPPKPKPVRPKIKLITKEEQEEFRLLDIDPTPRTRKKPVYSGERALSRERSDPELLGENIPEPDIWEEEPAWEDEVPEPESSNPEPDIWESDEDSQWEPEEHELKPVPAKPEPRYVSYEEEPVYERKPALKPVQTRPRQVVYEEEDIPEEEPVYQRKPEAVRPRQKPAMYEQEVVPEEEPVYRRTPEPVRSRPRKAIYPGEDIPEEEPAYEPRPERKPVHARPKRAIYPDEVVCEEEPEEEDPYEPPVRAVKSRQRAPEPAPIHVPPREPPARRERTESEIQSERRAGGRGIIRISDTGLGSDPFADLGRDRRSDSSHSSAIKSMPRKSAIFPPSETTRFREDSSRGVRDARDRDIEYDLPRKAGMKTERFSEEEGLGKYQDIDAVPEQRGQKRKGVKTAYFPEDEEQGIPEKQEPDEAGITFSTKPSLMGADRISDSKGKKKIGKFYEVEDLKRDPDYSDE